eukprot:753070-Hanusia_phi.AAC.1
MKEQAVVDCVLLLVPPPRPQKQPEEEEELELERAPSKEVPFNLNGKEREKTAEELMFEKFRAMSVQEDGGGNALPTAETVFLTVSLLPSEEEEVAFEVEGSFQEILRCLHVIVKSKIEYQEWNDGLRVVVQKQQPVDMRNYRTMISLVPADCISVPYVLNSMLQNVMMGSKEIRGKNDAAAVLETRRNNKLVNESLDSVMGSLIAPRSSHARDRFTSREDVPIFLQGDQQSFRLSSALLKPEDREMVREQERSVTGLRSVLDDVLGMFPPVPAVNEVERGLEVTELMSMLPSSFSSSKLARNLILCELERMVGYKTDVDGNALSVNPWLMEDIALDQFAYYEEMEEKTMRQVLESAGRTSSGDDRKLVMRYYGREDLVLVALCNVVPFQRKKPFSWRPSCSCFLGFDQWLQDRIAAKQAARAREVEGEREEEEAAEQANEEEEEEAEGGAGEGQGEKKRSEEDLPMPPRPVSGNIYRMDADKCRVWEEGNICFLSQGPRVMTGESKSERYVMVEERRHTISMRSESVEDAKFKLTVSYEDGSCASVRRTEGRTTMSIGFVDGLCVRVDSEGT